MVLDITQKSIMADPYLFLQGLSNYYDEFQAEHGTPEEILMNQDQFTWFQNSRKKLNQDFNLVEGDKYKNIQVNGI